MKIVICGSMTAAKKMLEIEKELVSLGYEAILPKFTQIINFGFCSSSHYTSDYCT